MCSDWEEEQEIVTPAQTACERACLRPAWRGRRHFHKADYLPILSLFNKASVCAASAVAMLRRCGGAAKMWQKRWGGDGAAEKRHRCGNDRRCCGGAAMRRRCGPSAARWCGPSAARRRCAAVRHCTTGAATPWCGAAMRYGSDAAATGRCCDAAERLCSGAAAKRYQSRSDRRCCRHGTSGAAVAQRGSTEVMQQRCCGDAAMLRQCPSLPQHRHSNNLDTSAKSILP